MKWCRYADDGLVHCRSYEEAEHMLAILRKRFAEGGLEFHPVKTKIVYCKDGSRKGNHEHTQLDFLGYTFRRRVVKNRKHNSLFFSFTPAVSKCSLTGMKRRIRELRVRLHTELSIAQMAKWLNPMLMAGSPITEPSIGRRSMPFSGMSTRLWWVGKKEV